VIIELVGDVFDLLLDELTSTSRVCSLPFREAGFEPKLLPVWSMLMQYIMKFHLSHRFHKHKDIASTIYLHKNQTLNNKNYQIFIKP